MADIYGGYFEYGGISSSAYGLIIANVNTGRNLSLAGSPSPTTIFNKKELRKHLIGDDYSSATLSFDIEIVTEDGSIIPQYDRRRVEKWLFGKSNYRKLCFDTYECADDISMSGINRKLFLYCRFINAEKVENSEGVIGYKATIDADSVALWSGPYEYEIEFTNSGTNTFNVNIDTDIDEYIYPTITLNAGSSGGSISIINNTDSATRETKIDDVSPMAKIIMNGELNYISGSGENYYTKFAKPNFVRLVDGKNAFTVVGDVSTLRMEYNCRRFM